MKNVTPIAIAALLIAACAAAGQTAKRDPHIGYLYPAGARRGQTARVLVGGQFLRGVSSVHISGDGVTAKVVKTYGALRNINGDQRQELQRRMSRCATARWQELVKAGHVKGQVPRWLARKPKPRDPKAEPVTLPEHPLLNNWESMSLRELAYVYARLTDRRKQQQNAQIAETVEIEVTIDENAAPGDRELRLIGRGGMTNPMVFQVGQLPEVREIEFNDPQSLRMLPRPEPYALPVVINGQILPGDVDRLRFRAEKGRQLVIEVQARHLVPFLADAVPGWFQAVVTIYDERGNELAFADDHHFDPDPVMLFEPPADGVYELEIRDSIHRGREDFVYRLSIGQFPFIKSLFPAGARIGHPVDARITGWNLPTRTLALPAQREGLCSLQLDHPVRHSNTVYYRVGELNEEREREPNDRFATSHVLKAGVIVNGLVANDGDVDIYRIIGRAGQPIVARVAARQLRSPLDALLRLTDASGDTIAINDDNVDKQGHLHRGMGVLTHFADACLSTTLPADGTYYLHVSDVTGHGSPAGSYRLYCGPPRPDFELMVEPSSISLTAGTCAPITVHAIRRDGFDGPITLKLGQGAKGFAVNGAVIPAGRDRVRLTITAPPRRFDAPIELSLTGSAKVAGRPVTRQATPADDVMQAFLWRHLVPAEQWLATVGGGGRLSSVLKRADDSVVQLPAGGSAAVHIDVPRQFRKLKDVQLRLSDPPAGVSISAVTLGDGKLTFDVRADATATVGVCDNLIAEVSVLFTWKQKDGKERSRRRSIGYLPAIPIQIVK